jgi:hypothetical protein
MKTEALSRWWRYAAGLLLVCLAGGLLPAQQPDEPLLPRLTDVSRWAAPDTDRPSALRGRFLRFYQMPTPVTADPVGADLDNDPIPPDAGAAPAADPDDLGLPVQAALYTDNPYFDFRRPGDVGGRGFYRIHTQLQLFETDTAGCTLGLQAVTPAGQENDGLADGPTLFYPNLALCQELFGGLAVEGFVGKNVRARPGWEDHIGRSLNYGVAVAQPLPCLDTATLPQVHLFVEALGRYRIEGQAGPGGPSVWQLLPGLHWRMGDNWWMSGGVLVPLTPGPRESGLWQVTCSWQF